MFRGGEVQVSEMERVDRIARIGMGFCLGGHHKGSFNAEIVDSCSQSEWFIHIFCSVKFFGFIQSEVLVKPSAYIVHGLIRQP
ncbi:MAG TPA: hypothetical protein DDX81_07735 [Desulfofustis sp.]|nr:hypothetical protein [Desulfofustis sp.]